MSYQRVRWSLIVVLWLDILYSSAGGADANQQDDSFIKRLVTTVINTLQIYVDKVHIRYEDAISTPHVRC
jgi:hypothetical protein